MLAAAQDFMEEVHFRLADPFSQDLVRGFQPTTLQKVFAHGRERRSADDVGHRTATCCRQAP